ncbi:CpaF family protein, partial [Candidatus Micrarchaeota archaeon CG_4_10_14_0_2_um_filter_60_11]
EAKGNARKRGEKPVQEASEGRTLVEQYGDVKIWRLAGDPVMFYETPAPHYRGEEKKLITSLIDIAVNVMPPVYKGLSQDEKEKRYLKEILEIIKATPEIKIPVNSEEFFARAVVREMAGYGIIDELTKDEWLEEIMVNGPNKPVFVYHRKYGMMKTSVVFYDDNDIRDLIDRIARNIGRRIDTQVPILDARLNDGTRVNATIPPISLDGSTLTLRKFRKDPLSAIDLLNYGTMNPRLAAFMWLCVDGLGVKPANILVAGGTASGKTSTLNVLSSFIPRQERIVSIEDTAELSLPLDHWIRFEVRPPSLEGTGEVDLNELVKNSLRMRPDRILVGEIRGAEGYTMFAAMNTGHSGCMGTVHANSARETLVRLESPPINVPRIMLSALNFIILQNRIHDRKRGLLRRITEFAEVVPTEEGEISLQVLYEWDPVTDETKATGRQCHYLQELKRYTGWTDEQIESEINERKEILESLQKKGVRKLEDVCAAIQAHAPERK